MNCKQCNNDTMYEKEDGKRCAVCGWTWKPTTGLLEERPTKPAQSVCGQVIEEWREHDNYEPIEVKGLCNDGSCCKFKPKSMTQLDDRTWIASCTTHNDVDHE